MWELFGAGFVLMGECIEWCKSWFLNEAWVSMMREKFFRHFEIYCEHAWLGFIRSMLRQTTRSCLCGKGIDIEVVLAS